MSHLSLLRNHSLIERNSFKRHLCEATFLCQRLCVATVFCRLSNSNKTSGVCSKVIVCFRRNVTIDLDALTSSLSGLCKSRKGKAFSSNAGTLCDVCIRACHCTKEAAHRQTHAKTRSSCLYTSLRTLYIDAQNIIKLVDGALACASDTSTEQDAPLRECFILKLCASSRTSVLNECHWTLQQSFFCRMLTVS